MQPQSVSNPASGNTRRYSSSKMRMKLFEITASYLQLRIVMRSNPDVNSRSRLRKRDGINTGVLQRFPTNLQQKRLLRIHRARFARRDSEVLRIKEINLPQPRRAVRGIRQLHFAIRSA